MIEKIAVFAPIPSASDRRATIVKPRLARSERTAYCTSRTTESSHSETSASLVPSPIALVRPNRRRASRCASSRVIPCSTSSSSRSAR